MFAESEVRELLAALRENRISPAQSARLNQLLAEHGEVRQMYLKYFSLVAALRWLDEMPLPAPRSRRTPVITQIFSRAAATVRSPILWSILTVACIFYGTFAFISRDLRTGAQPRQVAERSGPDAIVGRQRDVRWSTDARPGNEEAIETGKEFVLESGVVEVLFGSGAVLTVEGPATWAIDGENRATLKQGKVFAEVPPQARGFTVVTSFVDIVDLGTEFGVEVSPGQQEVQVVVHRGEVQVLPGREEFSFDSLAPITLHAGQSRQISRNRATGRLLVQSSDKWPEFVRHVESAGRSVGKMLPEDQIVIEDSGLVPVSDGGYAQLPFQPSATDLLQTSLSPQRPVHPPATHSGRFKAQQVGALFDGRVVDNTDQLVILTAGSYTGEDGEAVEFFLDGAKAPRGYVIERIELISGFAPERMGQSCLIFVRYQGKSGFEPRPLVTIREEPPKNKRHSARKISISGRNGVPLATNADAIAFMFLNREAAVYRELDVFGKPAP